MNELDREFTTRAFRGRTAEEGETWRAVVLPGGALGRNAFSSDIAELEIESATLRFYGAKQDRDDVYVYTDSLITMKTSDAGTADESCEGSVADATGHGGAIRDGRGKDVVDASAMTYDLVLNAAGGGKGMARGGDLERAGAALPPVRGHRHAGPDLRRRRRRAARRQRLEVGRGKDRLEGGGGSDAFVFGRGDGRDRVMDFKDGSDTIRLDGDLMGTGAQGTVIGLAERKKGDVLLDFGRGDVLVIEDTRISELEGDLDIFRGRIRSWRRQTTRAAAPSSPRARSWHGSRRPPRAHAARRGVRSRGAPHRADASRAPGDHPDPSARVRPIRGMIAAAVSPWTRTERRIVIAATRQTASICPNAAWLAP